MSKKIKTFPELLKILQELKSKGSKIAQCHGVFDLLHPGHLRHFKQAKEQSDVLVVTVTPDRYVNKGPGRPAFTESLRLEALASLSSVDYVILNDSPDAVSCIEKIAPDIYVKGKEYKDAKKDVTKKIIEEQNAVQKKGGSIFFTDDIVFSSSSLLNKHIDPFSQNVNDFIDKVKSKYSLNEILKKVEDLSKLRVLVIGDAIVDKYQYVEPLGQSGKGLHMVASCINSESFLGGSLIIAEHLSQFTNNVTLITSLGEKCSYSDYIKNKLSPCVRKQFVFHKEKSTLIKKRYVLKDGNNYSKLFETYSSNCPLLQREQTEQVISYIKQSSKEYDLVLVGDFDNGFTNTKIINCLSNLNNFLAINTQTNSGNRGYNVVTHYKRADFISLNEPEVRLAAHDRYSSLNGLVGDISEVMGCSNISITRGVKGALCFSKNEGIIKIPSLASESIDRVGAGDSFFAIASLAQAKGYSLLLSNFLGSIASAIDVQILCNKEPVKKASFCKFLTRLLK